MRKAGVEAQLFKGTKVMTGRIRKAMGFVLLAFIIYNANLSSMTSLDTSPTRYLPISILKEFDLDLDEFPFLHQYPAWWQGERSQYPYYVRYVRGHYMSRYPVMPAILSVPVYAFPVFLGLADGPMSAMGYTRTEIVGTFLSKISASAAVAFSVGILYLTLLRLTSGAAAFWIAFLYAFATSSWSLSSQGLWQTAMSQPLLALALYFFVKARESAHNTIYAGIALALSVACRPPNIVFALTFLIYVVRHYRAQLHTFLVFPVMLGMLLVTYNFYYFGSLISGYPSTTGYFTHPRLEGLLGLLISPSRGLLVYSPFLLFTIVGIASTFYPGGDHLLRYTAIASILLILLYSAFKEWHGGFSYSYRYLVDLLPGLTLFLAVSWNWIFVKPWRKTLFLSLAVFSILIQIVGSFFYPCGWYDRPVIAELDRQRFWDWEDPEFFRCLRAGPVDPDGLRFLREIIHR